MLLVGTRIRVNTGKRLYYGKFLALSDDFLIMRRYTVGSGEVTLRIPRELLVEIQEMD